MKNLNIHSFIVIVLLLLATSCNNNSQKTFGENADVWEVFGNADWDFSTNELKGEVTDGDGFVITQQKYTDFVLEIEFKPDSSINSGVFIRCQKGNEINPTDCYELNIWDLHPNQDNRTGAMVTKAKPKAIVETIGKWNTYKIQAKEGFIKVWVNDTLTTSVINNTLSDGYIGLQAKGTGEVSFRNLKITPLVSYLK